MVRITRHFPGSLLLWKQIFTTGFTPGSRLDCAYLIKELDSTCIMAHKPEAPTDTTELLTTLTWFTLPGFKPATLNSVS